MTQRFFPPQSAVEAGFDLGATLLKLAVRDADRAVHYASFPIEEEPVVFERFAGETSLRSAGFTGAGAGRAVGRLAHTCAIRVAEFDACGLGA